MRRSLCLTALIPAALVLLAACGSSADSSSNSMGMSDNSGMDHGSNGMEANNPVAAGARAIPVEAGALTFTPKRLQFAAGQEMAIVLTSIDIAHDFYVKGVGHVVHTTARKTAKGGLMIDKPGIYKFWCTVKDHKKDGMVGTITVTA